MGMDRPFRAAFALVSRAYAHPYPNGTAVNEPIFSVRDGSGKRFCLKNLGNGQPVKTPKFFITL
jgi:hypothetical protein